MKYPRFASDLADLRGYSAGMVAVACAPITPILKRSARIYTQGSCFAASLAQQLACQGIYAEHTGVPEEVNSPHANEAFLRSPESEAIKRNLPGVDAFIFTLGIAPPASSVVENAAVILQIINTIWEHNRDCRVILTVSPVPMNRADTEAVMADCLSKSKLRAAVEMVRETYAPAHGVYYWPSFEIVRWLAPHLSPAYGADDGMLRHVNADLVAMNCQLFVETFIEPKAEAVVA